MNKPKQPPTFNILIDTCVWLDVAKDYQQQAIMAALEELVRQGDAALILPRTVVDEFARNKARIIEESSRSLSSTLKRVKDAVEKFDQLVADRIDGDLANEIKDAVHSLEHIEVKDLMALLARIDVDSQTGGS